MDDLETRLAEQDLLALFPRNEAGRALAQMALSAWREAGGGEAREVAERQAGMAASYADHVFRSNAWFRDGDMEELRALPGLGLEEAAGRWRMLRDEWEALRAATTDEDDWAADEEAERIARLEDEGAYGRTLAYSEESERWIYVRFGGMPSGGRSRFGLAREDTEDGPDPWRQELGGMTHEAGVSVFRASMHPDVPGAYVLIAPAFDLARYGVESQESHLLSVYPRAKAGEEGTAVLVDGSLVTSRARDGTLRAELGSDGEYLVDVRKPFAVRPLSVGAIWVSERESLSDFLVRRRFHDRFDADDQDCGPPQP